MENVDNEIERITESTKKLSDEVVKSTVKNVVHRVVDMRALFGSSRLENSENIDYLSDVVKGDKVTLDFSGIEVASKDFMNSLSDKEKSLDVSNIEYRNLDIVDDNGANHEYISDVVSSPISEETFKDFQTRVIDLNEFLDGEEYLNSLESVQNLNKLILGIKNDEPDVDEIIVDFGRVKHVSYEAAKELSNLTGDDSLKIKFDNFNNNKVGLDPSDSIAHKIEPDAARGLSPEEDAVFLKEVENADRLSYAQSRMLAIVHPELIDKYSEKFDWDNASKCVAKYCPKAVLTNVEKFNFWDASDMLVKSDADVAEKVKDKLNPGKNRLIKMNDEVHPDQIRMMAEKGERLGLSAVCVDRLRKAYEHHESVSGQKFLELLSRDLFKAENFNMQRVPVDNDIVKALAVISEAGLSVDERTIRKIRINENQYMKLPSHDLGFSDLKAQLPALLKGERSALMHGVDDNGIMKDYKLQIGYDASTGNLQVKKLDRKQSLTRPEGISPEDWEKLSNGLASAVQSQNPIDGLVNGFKAGKALAELTFSYSIDKELNRVVATVDIPYNAIKESNNINQLQSFNESVEQQIREEKKRAEKMENDKDLGESVETSVTEQVSVSSSDISDVDGRLAAAEKEVAWLANETVTESSAEAEARMHMDLGRLEEIHDKEFIALGNGEQKLSNLQAEKNSQRQKLTTQKTVRKQNKVKIS